MFQILFAVWLAQSPTWHISTNSDGIGCLGYDPVSYFNDQPSVGLDQFTAKFEGVTYRFSTAENLEKFNEQPAKFVPAFGGWCAFACAVDASVFRFPQQRFPSDPLSYKIVDGKLLLFAKLPTFDAKQQWEKLDETVQMERAASYWADRQAMANSIGKLPTGMNPRAPMETAQFAFMLGSWKSVAQIMVDVDNKKYASFEGIWTAHYGWDGYALYDDWKPVGPAGGSGPAVRSYNPQKGTWTMAYIPIGAAPENIWLMEGKFDDQGNMEAFFDGVDATGRAFKQKVMFFDIHADSFSWRADRSYDEGVTWIERFQTSEQTRVKDMSNSGSP